MRLFGSSRNQKGAQAAEPPSPPTRITHVVDPAFAAGNDAGDLPRLLVVVRQASGVAGLDERRRRRLFRQFGPRVLQQYQCLVQGDQQGVPVALAHGPDESGRAACHAGAVAERAGRQAEGQRSAAGTGDREGLGQQVRQVRDARDRPVVFGGLGGYDDGTAVQRELRDLCPDGGVDAVVGADHPHGLPEQVGAADAPPGRRRPRHRVPAHVAVGESLTGCRRRDLRLDADDVGDRTVRCVQCDRGERGGDGGHGDRDHDQRRLGRRTLEYRDQICVGVETVRPGGVDGRRGSVVTPRFAARPDRRTQQ